MPDTIPSLLERQGRVNAILENRDRPPWLDVTVWLKCRFDTISQTHYNAPPVVQARIWPCTELRVEFARHERTKHYQQYHLCRCGLLSDRLLLRARVHANLMRRPIVPASPGPVSVAHRVRSVGFLFGCRMGKIMTRHRLRTQPIVPLLPIPAIASCCRPYCICR